MNTSMELRTGQKWRKRRNQTPGSLILTLGHLKDNVRKASSRVMKSRRKLHVTKTELTKIIAEVKKLEREVRLKTHQNQHTGTLLEAAIQEVHGVQDQLTEGDIMAIFSARIDLRISELQMEAAETAVHTENLIVPEEANDRELAVPVHPTPMSIELSDVDSSGVLEEVGHINFSDTKKCSICLKNDIDCIFYQCGHQCCCFGCANIIFKNCKKCPLCHRVPKKIVKTYYV